MDLTLAFLLNFQYLAHTLTLKYRNQFETIRVYFCILLYQSREALLMLSKISPLLS